MLSAKKVFESTDDATLKEAILDIVEFRRTAILPESSKLRDIARSIVNRDQEDDFSLRLAEDAVLLHCALKWAENS